MEPEQKEKMTYNVRPTPRMVETVKNLVDSNGETRSMRAAMIKAGYSEATAKNPKQLTESAAFKALMVQLGVTMDELILVLRGGLNAMRQMSKVVDVDEKGRPIYDTVDVDDWPTRHRYLETALKLWGLPHPEPADGGQKANTINNFIDARHQQKNDYNL